jgi:7-cyano-7-deazaguanine synthase
MKKKAIVLLSGGLDSTTCLAMVKAEGFDCYALSIDYGQKQKIELERAKKIASELGAVEHIIIKAPLGEWRGAALIDENTPVPDYKGTTNIPITYVPARNTIFLSLALGWAEVVGAYDIFYGANIMDYAGYPDCRPEYIAAFEKMANLATKKGINGEHFRIHAPLLKMSKQQIIEEGMRLKIDYSKTISCYRPDDDGRSCGKCDSCTYRKKGFLEAGVADPTVYTHI